MPPVIVRMWEARSRPAVFDEFLAWVCEKAVPEVEGHPQHVSSEVFSSTDHRVVVISRWHRDPLDLPAPPPTLVARSPHVWDFTQVDR
ncbi:hypothetical protein GCM10009557_75390 [Virgisporangium ochraceum]|uniref:ABM domain-containing protein n=1 Tax=Virgisporangium ochraceum TaxID=65505 RepID=A0A8J3ZJD1_9ACTN|nr:hypothetical protein Voc01_002310 [Virgisporangium ochraceum]